MARWTIGLVAALLAVLLTVQPLLAADAPLRRAGFQCDDGVCRARLDLGANVPAWLADGVGLRVAQAAVSRLPGGEFAVRDDVLLSLPSGPLRLLDADLVITLDQAGRVATLRGSAQAPLPTFGLLGDGLVITPARVAVGVEYGSELVHLSAPLDPARRYFFAELAAGMGVLAGGVDLAVAPGQRATLVMDFAAPMFFVDGGITVRSDGQWALVQQWLGGAGEWGLPTELPLRQLASLRLQAQAGRDIAPRLALDSTLRWDTGMVGQWLRLDATPLTAQGRAVISGDGVELAGTVATSVAPDHLVTGKAQALLFVPFAAPETAALMVTAESRAPLQALAARGETVVAREPGWQVGGVGGAWAGLVAGTVQAGTATQTGVAWVGNSLASGGEWLTTGAVNAWSGTQRGWCGLTGWCAEERAAQAAAQIALVE